MSTADQLLEEMFSWFTQRERCAERLKKLANELESLREICNATECIGSTTAVIGSVCLCGAGLATLLTGGAAAPLLGFVGGVSSGLGAGISVVTKITEHFNSSDTLKDAQRTERESNKITQKIQKLFENLEEEKRSACSSADDVDKEIMREILKAMARRIGQQYHFILDMLDKGVLFCGGKSGNTRFNPSFDSIIDTLGGILSFFELKARGGLLKIVFAKGGKQLAKMFSNTGLRTALKGSATALGGVIGLVFELPDAIDQWEELINNNHVTAASQSLRDTANDLLKISQTLREQLDKIHEMFKDFEKLKRYIENRNRSLAQKNKFIELVKMLFNDEAVIGLLSEMYGPDPLLRVMDIFYFLKKELDEKKKKTNKENIDIIFVAHGSIREPLIPASTLLPLSTIKDVVLYSPWNCTIDSKAAYGIATGNLKPEHRHFYCSPGSDSHHSYILLPNHWNSMEKAGEQEIPTIFVSPLEDPADEAWDDFTFLQSEYGEPERNRVVIPYKLPKGSGKSEAIPLSVVTLALSLVLFVYPFKATFHLAACLRRPSGTELTEHAEDLNKQYSWATDQTGMTYQKKLFQDALGQYTKLYRAFQAVFDH